MIFTMTDRDLIIVGFVDKYYELSDVGHDTGRIVPFGLRFKKELHKEHLSPGSSTYQTVHDLAYYVTGIYSDFITDEGMTVTEMINDWFKSKYDIIYTNIIDSLKGVDIRLGVRNWELTRNGEIFFWKQLVNEFDGEYSKESIKVIYDNWYQRKVLEVSEAALNAPF